MSKIVVLILFILPILGWSQDAPVIFDRPGISDSPYIVDSNRWIVESVISASDQSDLSSVLTPNIMVRKYLGFKTELRATYNYSPQMMGMINKNQTLGFDFIALGFKRKLWMETKVLPEASMIINTFYPTQRIASFKQNNIYNLEVCFQFQSHISDYFALNYNVGTIFTDQYKKGIINYSLCATGLIHKDVEAFIEVFGYSVANEHAEFGYDAGIIYYPNRWSQIDVSMVNNRLYTTTYSGLFLGYSFSIDTKKS
jgi:hypothetical protein